jgi:phytoene dehydrogenase-like protein
MGDSQSRSRRQAIRYLIGGAVAAACPFPSNLWAANTAVTLGSEQNKLCHQVRDGAEFKFPASSAEYDVVIVGGGASGLMCGYKLRNLNLLLLEKEPRLGGNAISEQWRGQWYSTGAAYQEDEEVEALCREIGMEIHPIRSVDAAIINNTLVPEFWAEGLWKSPYPDSVKKNFGQFVKDMKALDLEKNAEKLDNLTFAELLKPYGPEVKAWFDNFGPNNWGADTENTSALVGAESVRWGGGVLPNRFTWPGGLGRISLALEERLQKAVPGRLRKGATVLQVETKTGKVQVSYSENDELKTVSARTVVLACQKFITKKIVKGLDQEHLDAMDEMRYQPYLVVNVCSNQVIYNGSFDTNIPAPCMIVDFNVADWVINRDNKEVNRPAVLTCYVPRPEGERSRILRDDYCTSFGQKVVDQLEVWFPGAKSKIEEVHIYRRGHPMYASAPGVVTRVAPKLRQPFGNIFFGHSDSEGGVTDYSTALQAAERTSKEVMAALGKRAARETVTVST